MRGWTWRTAGALTIALAVVTAPSASAGGLGPTAQAGVRIMTKPGPTKWPWPSLLSPTKTAATTYTSISKLKLTLPTSATGAIVLNDPDIFGYTPNAYDLRLTLPTTNAGTVALGGVGTARTANFDTVVYDGGDAGAVIGQVMSNEVLKIAAVLPAQGTDLSASYTLVADLLGPALQSDGRVLVMGLVDTDNPYSTEVEPDRWEVVYTFAAPTALDANRRPVRTWYTLDDTTNVLTQHIEPAADTVFPVAAITSITQNEDAAKLRAALSKAERAVSEAAAVRDKARDHETTLGRRRAVAFVQQLEAKAAYEAHPSDKTKKALAAANTAVKSAARAWEAAHAATEVAAEGISSASERAYVVYKKRLNAALVGDATPVPLT